VDECVQTRLVIYYNLSPSMSPEGRIIVGKKERIIFNILVDLHLRVARGDNLAGIL